MASVLWASPCRRCIGSAALLQRLPCDPSRLPRLLWIIGILAACAVVAVVLALAVIPRLVRRRGQLDADEYGAIGPAKAVPLAGAPPWAEVPRPQRPAIAPVHIHFHGLTAAEQAAIIRGAIPGRDGETSIGER